MVQGKRLHSNREPHVEPNAIGPTSVGRADRCSGYSLPLPFPYRASFFSRLVLRLDSLRLPFLVFDVRLFVEGNLFFHVQRVVVTGPANPGGIGHTSTHRRLEPCGSPPAFASRGVFTAIHIPKIRPEGVCAIDSRHLILRVWNSLETKAKCSVLSLILYRQPDENVRRKGPWVGLGRRLAGKGGRASFRFASDPAVLLRNTDGKQIRQFRSFRESEIQGPSLLTGRRRVGCRLQVMYVLRT